MAETITTRDKVMREIIAKIADSSLRASLLAKCGTAANVDYFKAIVRLSLQDQETARIFAEWLAHNKQNSGFSKQQPFLTSTVPLSVGQPIGKLSASF